MYKNYKYTCPKYGGKHHELSEIRTTGSFMMKLFKMIQECYQTFECRFLFTFNFHFNFEL